MATEFGHSEIPAKLKAENRGGARARRRRKWRVIRCSRSHFYSRFFGLSLAVYCRAISRRSRSSHGRAAVPEKSIAVLPFENLRRDEVGRAISSTACTTRFSPIWRESARSQGHQPHLDDAIRYRDGTKSPRNRQGPRGGQRRGRHRADGTGKRVRVSVQLIDARSDTHLWAESYDRDVSDIFALESELAETIVAQLKAKLSPEEKAAIEEESTSDPLAHDLYLRRRNALIATPLIQRRREPNNLLRSSGPPRKGGGTRSEILPGLLPARRACTIRFISTGLTTPRPGSPWPKRRSKRRSGLRPDAGETHLALRRTSLLRISSTTIAPGASWSWPGVPCLTNLWFLSWLASLIAARAAGTNRRANCSRLGT